MTTMPRSAETVPDPDTDDIVVVLHTQHERIKGMFADVQSATGEARQDAFDSLRAFLAVHEAAEETLLRPVTRQAAGERVATARNEEEKEASTLLADLEDMDVASAEFADGLATLQAAVIRHAQSEEAEELPALVAEKTAEERSKLGKAFKAAEAIGPTHPHPSTTGSSTAQLVVGPFAAMFDRAKDLITGH